MQASQGTTSGARSDAPARPNGTAAAADGASGVQSESRRFSLPRLTLRGGARDDRPSRAAPAPVAADVASDAADDADWKAVGLFGAGLVLGALLGAGTALLLAPATGFETRTRLVRRARAAGEQAADRWDDLGDRVRSGAKRSRRKLERKLTVSRWRAQDAWERKRYGSTR